MANAKEFGSSRKVTTSGERSRVSEKGRAKLALKAERDSFAYARPTLSMHLIAASAAASAPHMAPFPRAADPGGARACASQPAVESLLASAAVCPARIRE